MAANEESAPPDGDRAAPSPLVAPDAPPLHLGDRMKAYEAVEAQRRLNPRLPILVRLDGRAFHSFTRGLQRPFDARLTECMVSAALAVMHESNAALAYTQSDEISLVLLPGKREDDVPYFAARVQKLCSILAATASVTFNSGVRESIPSHAQRLAVFDARAWNVPSLSEAAQCILWRELDAEKNSVAALAQSKFPHKQLLNKHRDAMKEMLLQAGHEPWDALPVKFRRGVYLKRVRRTGAFTAEEMDALPPKHAARTNPDLVFERSAVERVELPRLIEVAREGDLVRLLFE